MIPKAFENETDYRKIPREYLETNIPRGRGSVKWQPFATIPEQYEQLEQFMKDQNKIERPELFNDELEVLNDMLQQKMYYNEKATIEYWKRGYFYHHSAFIKRVDTLRQVLVVSNERGNEVLEIPLKDIRRIE